MYPGTYPKVPLTITLKRLGNPYKRQQQHQKRKTMGERDYENLHIIYRQCVEWCKKYKLPFKFKVDAGSFETAIEFSVIGYNHPPKSENWEESRTNGNEIKCPDILDFEHRIIIEYEEEPKPGKKMGRLGKKGHTEESTKDSHRDYLYRISGFHVLKFWETDLKQQNWEKIHNFLLECSAQQEN